MSNRIIYLIRLKERKIFRKLRRLEINYYISATEDIIDGNNKGLVTEALKYL